MAGGAVKTIVISGLHLGLDDRISEGVRNRPKLVDFCDLIRAENMADELVVCGLSAYVLATLFDAGSVAMIAMIMSLFTFISTTGMSSLIENGQRLATELCTFPTGTYGLREREGSAGEKG